MNKKNVLLTALAIAGFAVTSLAQTVPNYLPTNGLVGWWPFNGNAIDESINTNDGTVNGATLTTDRFGSANSAYSFNGTSDFISVPDNNSLDFTNTLSFSIWVKIPDYSHPTVGDLERTALGKQRSNNGGGFNFIPVGNYNDAKYSFGLQNLSTSAGASSTDSIPLSSWTHIIGVYDGVSVKLYKNGLLKCSANATLSLINSIQPLFIGKELNTSGRFFKGEIDDVALWNRALTQQEITGLNSANLCFQTITVTDTLLINTNITGFNPVTYQNTIKIWPNPTNDHITIDNGNLANLTGHQIKISNALGQQVFQSAITQQQFYVDMSTWGGNGIYFVNLINSQGVTIETRKIVLQ
jgi:hypothetical protein